MKSKKTSKKPAKPAKNAAKKKVVDVKKKKVVKKAPVRKAAKAVKAPKVLKKAKRSKTVKPVKVAKAKPVKARKPAKKAPRQPKTRNVPPAPEASPDAAAPDNAFTVREALEIAIQFEQKVRDHYNRGAEIIQEPAGRRVFSSLAKEEQGHVDFLKDRLSELTSTGTVEAKKLSSILPSPDWVREAEQKHRAAATAKRVAEQDEVEALKTSLHLEKEASSFYHDLVHRLPAADRGLFEQFLTIEDGHLAIVQAELDAVQGWGYWFDVQEFALEAQ